MFGLTARGIVFLVTGLVAAPAQAGSDEPTESRCDVISWSTASQAVDSQPAADSEASPCSHPQLRSELLAMAQQDQAVRGRINSEGETPELLEEESRIDWRNTAQMKLIVDEFGWPTQSMVGKDGAKAAWLIAMHADHDTKFQRRCLNLMKAALKHDQVSAIHVAYLTDRVRTREGKPQVYGTQNGVIDGVRLYFPIEDIKHVDKRRAEVGLPPLGEYRELPKSLVITLGRPRPGPAQQGEQGKPEELSEREAMYYRYLEFASYVKGGTVEPHWMADGSSFWYAEGAPGNTVIWRVDPNANTKATLFDTVRLRQALTALLGHEPPYQGLPFAEFSFVEGEKAVKFTIENKDFTLQLDTYTITPLPPQSEEERTRRIPQVVWRDVAGRSRLWEVLSPDSSWFAGVRDNNLWLRATNEDRSVQMTVDGIEDYGWSVTGAKWSPDGSKLALQKEDYREVPKIPIVHWLKPTVDVEWAPMRSGFSRTKAGGPLPRAELYVIDVETGQQVRVDPGEEPDQHLFSVTWRRDGSELLFLRASRTLNKLDLMGADPYTGATRVILTETQETFVGQYMFSELEESKGFMWMSERDGWNHVYLYDMDGNLIRRLTEGEYPVLRIEAVDETGGWLYFTAHAERRLYDTHLYRIDLEGNNFTRLTEGTGGHFIRFAPSQQFFLDTHSNTDRSPTVELRRADGTLLQVLSKAKIDELVNELKWTPPEEFVVKAADGKTDLYGVLYKPYDFDRERKYPVIEYIYAGPQLSDVQRTFMNDYAIYPRALAQLGFVVFVVDGRGTPGRSKAFQDVAYGNLGRHEIADHMAALMQLAGRQPYMDLDRVGIFGHSYGGYMTLRALLLAPDVYHVGVATSPVVDLYFGNFTEIYMGLPENNKEGYEYASNLPLVDRLQGKLLVIHGTSDFSAVFSGTMKLVEALIQAGKPIDMLVLPERGHVIDVASIILEKDNRYIGEAIRRYFQEHLKP